MSRPSAEPSSNSTNPTPTEHDSSSSTTPKSPNTANSTSPTNSPPPSNTTLPNTDLVADDLLFGTPTMTPNPHTETATATATTPTPAGHGTAGHGTAGHGTATRYNTGCRCQHCRTAIATYRRHRRAHGHDRPTRHRRTRHDQHLDRSWFRRNIWYHALANAGLTHPARIHDLRHTNASWMLAGGADLETIRERLGHRSLRATERYLHTLPHTHNTALTALHRTRTTNPPSTPAPGQAHPNRGCRSWGLKPPVSSRLRAM